MHLFINSKNATYYYDKPDTKLLEGDCLDLMPKMQEGIIDMIFADPPYFLSNGGISCQAGKRVSVNKGKWDEGFSLDRKHEFNRMWIRECRRLLKPNGSIWVSGTLHNIYSVGMALEQEGFKILNNITWQKKNPPPNLSCRYFTHSTETILWARPNKKVGHYFNYALMKEANGGKQMKDVWSGSLTPQKEKTEGRHPTQKPEYLLERIILSSTEPEALILDPFVGSGTTVVVAKRHGRRGIGIDNEKSFLEIAKKRLQLEEKALT